MKINPRIGILVLSISLALVGSLAVMGQLSTSKTLSSTGAIKGINVEVYWDVECTQVVNSVDWGIPEPGDSLIRTIYVKNIGNSPMTLNMSCSGWDPAEAESYLSVSWDRDGATIDADEVVSAVLTLSVSDLISGITDFSFNIIIQGTG